MESPAAHDLLIGVLNLCSAIGAPATAEMVESAAQHDLLRALGVDKLQGNFLSPPLTPEAELYACCGNQSRPVPVNVSGVSFDKRLLRPHA